MPQPPVFEIDPNVFHDDPYPILKRMRAKAPIAFVPALNAILITQRDDIFSLEKQIDVFSSDQPDGLMTKLMGQNMMRKDGNEHLAERKAIFPTVSPKTVQNVWKKAFQQATTTVLDRIAPNTITDLVTDFAMPVSAEALKAMTGLVNMSWQEMDRVSQGMIDGCANYSADPQVEARCNECTASIDRHIDERMASGFLEDDLSLLAVQLRAGLSLEQSRANIKLAISGGQNEPRDAIAGLVWALLKHPNHLADLTSGALNHLQVFEEYCRWISPIGMSPRRVARAYSYKGLEFRPEQRVFFMFGSGNRDESVFAKPDVFDPYQDSSKAIAFGAGPHFCAGAWASKCLIAEVAMPMLLSQFSNIKITGPVEFSGWAFRGPASVPVAWKD
ncbi:cytochrome P450 [Rhodobacteraceae bacterium nBUS_24]